MERVRKRNRRLWHPRLASGGRHGQFTGGPPAFQAVTTPDAPPASHTFSANIPIQAGDLIGIDIPPNNGVNGYTPAEGSTWSAWDPALSAGSTSAPNPLFTGPGTEMAFNATVQYLDAATPGKAKKCKKKEEAQALGRVCEEEVQEEKEALSEPGATSE